MLMLFKKPLNFVEIILTIKMTWPIYLVSGRKYLFLLNFVRRFIKNHLKTKNQPIFWIVSVETHFLKNKRKIFRCQPQSWTYFYALNTKIVENCHLTIGFSTVFAKNYDLNMPSFSMLVWDLKEWLWWICTNTWKKIKISEEFVDTWVLKCKNLMKVKKLMMMKLTPWQILPVNLWIFNELNKLSTILLI